MSKREKIIFLLLIISNIGGIWAAPSLHEIRYELFKNPSAEVITDLKQLAKFGDRQSMLVLGNKLMEDNGAVNGEEALTLFKQSFAEGQGEIVALTSMARLLDANVQLHKKNSDYVKRALQQYPFTKDPRTVAATLEVFVAYPKLLNSKQVEALIVLYENSCLAYCRSELFKAILAEQQGNKVLALAWYEKAFFTDSRAVIRYYRLLDEDQDKLFPIYAKKLEGQMNALPVITVHNIASILDIIYGAERAILLLKGRRIHEQNKKLTGEAFEKAKAQEEINRNEIDSRFARTQNEINRWLDNAIARNWVPAMVSKVNKMASAPMSYTAEETVILIDRVAQTEPQTAKALTVNIAMVSSWSTLNPRMAYKLIQELQAEHYASANMLLATLYNRGVLDEPDQAKALAILEGEAKNGSASAFYVMANLYYQGRAICRDKVKAYANLLMANDLGELRAAGLLKQITSDMNKEEKQQGNKLYQQLAKEYQ